MNEFLLGDGGSAETPAEQPDKPVETASERFGQPILKVIAIRMQVHSEKEICMRCYSIPNRDP